MAKKNKTWLSECCNKPMYDNGMFSGYSCSGCDGDGEIHDDWEECDDEECDGTCSICSPKDYYDGKDNGEVLTITTPKFTAKHYNFDALLPEFQDELSELMILISKALCNKEKWYPSMFYQLWLERKEAILIIAKFTTGVNYKVINIELIASRNKQDIILIKDNSGQDCLQLETTYPKGIIKRMINRLKESKSL